MYSGSQHQLFFTDQLPEVDQSVSHPAKACVDADVGDLRDFFETEVAVVTHDNHLPLIKWQIIN